MENESDPRVFFASERTMLAWLRSGIAVIGLGFLVARFGLFLAATKSDREPMADFLSIVIGISFVLLGALMIGAAARQHWKFLTALDIKSKPHPYTIHFSLWIANSVAIASLALAAYLLYSLLS